MECAVLVQRYEKNDNTNSSHNKFVGPLNKCLEIISSCKQFYVKMTKIKIKMITRIVVISGDDDDGSNDDGDDNDNGQVVSEDDNDSNDVDYNNDGSEDNNDNSAVVSVVRLFMCRSQWR